MPQPFYTPENTRAAYQLNWSYVIFWHAPPKSFDWLEDLQQATEADRIRILNHSLEPPLVSKFLVSTLPTVAPQFIPHRVKGRLQHLLQRETPNAFRRNYSLRSVGSTKRDKVEAYLASQLAHHPMADERVQERLAQYQICDPQVALANERQTSHGIYWYNLHLVFVMRDRDKHLAHGELSAIREMIRGAAKAKNHLLSRASILPDHVHLALGCQLDETPEVVALSYMNNICFALGMKPVLQSSYWVGTFGEYDLGAVK